MKDLLTFVALLFLACACGGQAPREPVQFTLENFDAAVLQYEPVQRAGVTDAEFDKGVFFLSETKTAAGNDPTQLNAGDYWNLTVAFKKLGEPKEHIRIAFQKAITTDPASICAYISSLGNAALDRIIPETFLPFYQEHCLDRKSADDTFDLEGYLADHPFDAELVKVLDQVSRDDKRFRSEKEVPWEKQTPLDRRNQAIIDSLYQVYGTYIGRSLVGNPFATTMWAVVQHSNLDMMEKYLPVIHKATEDQEIPDNIPLKMLIDRIYLQQFGYQVFGSQGGDLAPEEIREEVKKKYGLQ